MLSRLFNFAAWSHRGPFIVQSLAVLALAAGMGVWSAVLFAPRPQVAPPLLASGPAPGQNIAPLVQWFGGGSARLRVAVVGLLSSGQQGTALLSINGGAPKAYSVGHTLAQGVTLVAVSSPSTRTVLFKTSQCQGIPRHPRVLRLLFLPVCRPHLVTGLSINSGVIRIKGVAAPPCRPQPDMGQS